MDTDVSLKNKLMVIQRRQKHIIQVGNLKVVGTKIAF